MKKKLLLWHLSSKGEAKGDMDRGFISGILWHRLYRYATTSRCNAGELQKKKGLPDSPIANPGLAAIRAAMYPEESPYLFIYMEKMDRFIMLKILKNTERI